MQACGGALRLTQRMPGRRRGAWPRQFRQRDGLRKRRTSTKARRAHSLHDALGTSSPRVKQFVVQQNDDSPELDEVMIVLSRVSSLEYEAICTALRRLPVVKEFREDDGQG